MFKFLKELNKLISGILFLILPVIIFYWTLILINLDFLKPIIFILGSFINPLMLPFKSFIEYSVKYDNFSVDYTVLFFAAITLGMAYMCTIIGHILEFIEKKVEKTKVNIEVKEKLREKQEEKQEFIKEITKNKTIYVILKLIRNDSKESYLVNDEEIDFFSVGLVDSHESSLVNLCKKYSGNIHGKLGGSTNLNNYIFTDINKFLEFLPCFITRIEEINKGMFDFNTRFDYKIACHCSYSDASIDVDFDITSNILNLCGNKEILLSELLKSRLEIIKNNKFNLYSKGLYLIKDKQMDVFKFKIN